MKRSEMVNLISSFLELGDGSCFSKEEYNDHANILLSKIEEAGMLPPKSSDGLDDDFGNEICGPCYEWEKE